MNIEVREKKLYDACLEGDVETLKELMREDGLALSQVSIASCFNQTPLHLASMLGHFEFVKSLLYYKSDFASRLDSHDRSPLHVASANGYANIVKLLLEYDQEMCRVHDEDGKTPLHLAVMNSQYESVVELIKVKSELFDEEGTVLHFCVMYNRLNLLIRLLELNHQDLTNIKDSNGDTILHSAAALKRMQMIKYLVKSRKVNVNAVNENGLTALDIIEKMPKDLKTMEIKDLLLSANTLSVNEVIAARKTSLLTPRESIVADDSIEGAAATDSERNLVKMCWNKVKNFTVFQDKSEKRDETVLLAATVIAAMAYQAAISPPGGTAGMDATEASAPSPYEYYYDLEPGASILGYFSYSLSNVFWTSNTISFMAALSVIFLYVSGATLKQKFFIWLIRAAMWITLTAMSVAYVCAVHATTPTYSTNHNTINAILFGLYIWIGLVVLSISVVVYRASRYVVRTIKTKRHRRMKIYTSNDAATSTTQNGHIV